MFSMFNSDPFFSDTGYPEHNDPFRNGFGQFGAFHQMPNMFSPFAIEGPPVNQRQPPQPRTNNAVANRFGGFGDLFGGADPFSGMMEMQRRMFDNNRMGMMNFETGMNDPNSHSYSQTSFQSYSSLPDQEPVVYEAHSSTRMAPGGLKETRKMVKDSRTQLEKAAVEHHIKDRSHVRERQRYGKSGEFDESNHFSNVDEDAEHAFDNEWRQKTSSFNSRGTPNLRYHRNDRKAIRDSRRNREY